MNWFSNLMPLKLLRFLRDEEVFEFAAIEVVEKV